jgi:hypothetical protein
MNSAERNVLIAIALFVLGLVMVMNWTPSTAIEKDTVAPAGVPEKQASIITSPDLHSSVDLAKTK